MPRGRLGRRTDECRCHRRPRAAGGGAQVVPRKASQPGADDPHDQLRRRIQPADLDDAAPGLLRRREDRCKDRLHARLDLPAHAPDRRHVRHGFHGDRQHYRLPRGPERGLSAAQHGRRPDCRAGLRRRLPVGLRAEGHYVGGGAEGTHGHGRRHDYGLCLRVARGTGEKGGGGERGQVRARRRRCQPLSHDAREPGSCRHDTDDAVRPARRGASIPLPVRGTCSAPTSGSLPA